MRSLWHIAPYESDSGFSEEEFRRLIRTSENLVEAKSVVRPNPFKPGEMMRLEPEEDAVVIAGGVELGKITVCLEPLRLNITPAEGRDSELLPIAESIARQLNSTLADVTPILYPEISAQVTYKGIPLPEDFIKLGGVPDFIQSDDYPVHCNREMTLVVQIRSVPSGLLEKHRELSAYTFGDSGILWVFACSNSSEYQTSWQCC